MESDKQTIISQYGNSPSIRQMIDNLNDCIDPQVDIDAFYNDIWNIETATGYGLDVWGRIVCIGRVLAVASSEYFGLESSVAHVASGVGFGQGPFYAGQPTTGNYPLSDDAYRLLIYAKALANICDGSIKALNQILLYLFPGRGNCYVVNNNDMTMVYKFDFTLSPVEKAIVSNSGVLPVTAGVSASVSSP